jgi:2-haloacid dehalogenase
MALGCIKSDSVAPLTNFKAIRAQMDELGFGSGCRIRTRAEIPALVAAHES